MSDEFDDLKKIMREDVVMPRADARERAIEAGLTAFDAENFDAAQGSAAPERQRGRFSIFLQTLFGRRSMTLSNPSFRYMLAGGAGVAVLAVVVFGSNLPRQFTPPLTTVEVGDDQVAGDKEEAGTVVDALRKNAEVDTVVGGATARRDQLAEASQSRNERDANAPDEAGARESVESRLTVADAEPVSSDERARNKVATEGEVVAAAPQPQTKPSAAPLTESFADVAVDRAAGVSGIVGQSSPAPASSMVADAPVRQQYEDQGRDQFTEIEANPVHVVGEDPVSTFSIDVDTASYSFMRGSLNQGVLPQKDAVRVEELINYFPYDYVGPDDRETPFRANVSMMPTPWNEGTRLMSIGIKGYAMDAAETPHSNLVFLIDTSGSMNATNKLPLLINSFKLLLDTLNEDDTVAIVTYAGSAGMALEPTKVAERAKILASLERLGAGGSTAGAEGIRQAYLLAEQNKVDDGVNRVILATDGDFNVGITDQEELKSYIERKRETGIFLSVLGFGRGNYNDALMQALAQNGNGNAAYIDSLSEARKVLVEEATSTLFTIAKDVKIQVEFNPAMVSEYRLIGYETRMLAREDFNNDKVDAGDIGAGHTVTALYELTLVGGAELVDPLRYQPSESVDEEAATGEYAFLKVRYKLPDSDTSTLTTLAVTDEHVSGSVDAAPREARFAAAVAGFGQLIRGGRYTGDYSYDDVVALANGAKGEDEFGYRSEFVGLVRLAKSAADMESLRR
jgi:Ca-activated chloride channel family protein